MPIATTKSGYKQTDVGFIPSDWAVRPLFQLAHVRTGIAKNANNRVSDPISVHYLRVANVQDGFLDLTEMNEIEIERADVRRFAVLPGDVLMNEGGDRDKLGRGCVWEGQLKPCVHQNHVFVVRCTKQLCPQYLTAWTRTSVARKYFVNAGSQTTNLASINKTALGLLPVVLPPRLAEQEAIAAALSDADGLIETLEKLIAKKRQIKHGTMQELLTGKRRLPGFPGEWETKLLGELGRCVRGVSYNPAVDLYPHDTLASVRLLRSNNVQDSIIVFTDMQYVDTSRVNHDQYLRNDDVLICMANGSRDLAGKAGRFSTDDGYRYTFGAFMGAFRPNTDAVNVLLAFYLFQTETYRKHIAILLAGSSINNLTPGSVEALSILIPTALPEQAAIAAILSDMDAEIAALEAKRAKARQVKQGMMQELLTGRTRLI
jgi:type I restriction enzyme S subunit